MWAWVLALPIVSQTLPLFWDLQHQYEAYRVPGGTSEMAHEYSAAFAVAGLLEYESARGGTQAPVDLSEEFLIWAAREAGGGTAAGQSLQDMLRGLEEYGVCEATLTPKRRHTDLYDPAFAPSAAAVADAAQRKNVTARWFKEWDPTTGMTDGMLGGLKQEVAAGHPVAVGVLWPKAPRLGYGAVLEMPLPDDVLDGRALLLTRYADGWGQPDDGLFNAKLRVYKSDVELPEVHLTYGYLKRYGTGALALRLPDEQPLTNVAFESPIEMETLTVGAMQGCPTEVQDMAPYGKERWSGGSQLLCRCEEGGAISFLLTGEKLESRYVYFTATRGPDYGMVRVYSNQDIAIGSIDLYYPEVTPTGPLGLGPVLVCAAGTPIRFEVRSKNRQSTGFSFGLDCIEVRRDARRWGD